MKDWQETLKSLNRSRERDIPLSVSDNHLITSASEGLKVVGENRVLICADKGTKDLRTVLVVCYK